VSPEELQGWLLERAAEISAFTDYEITFSSEADLREKLGRYWFRDPDWNEAGYRFVSLGQDGGGSEVALWLGPRQSNAAPVVFFGSEGGSGVVSASPSAFVQALAYAPLLQEYRKGDLDAPSRLSLEDNWFLSGEDPEQTSAANGALARYRQSTEERFGQLPPFERLIDVPPTVQAEFREWVIGTQTRVSAREALEQRHTRERKHRDMRDKATRFAAASAQSLPPNATSLKDGLELAGRCANCGASSALRLTRFEELAFGLCLPCYFSKVW
jgi:hypothetical protein